MHAIVVSGWGPGVEGAIDRGGANVRSSITVNMPNGGRADFARLVVSLS